MWDPWCGCPHPCSDDPASSSRWYSFLKPISHAWAASQPTCLRKTELLLPATPWALRMITHCWETSAITVWKADACQIPHATIFPCLILSQHRSCCRCHDPDPARHLPGWCHGMAQCRRCSSYMWPTPASFHSIRKLVLNKYQPVFVTWEKFVSLAKKTWKKPTQTFC